MKISYSNIILVQKISYECLPMCVNVSCALAPEQFDSSAMSLHHYYIHHSNLLSTSMASDTHVKTLYVQLLHHMYGKIPQKMFWTIGLVRELFT